MRRYGVSILFAILIAGSSFSQKIVWTDITSSYALPTGIRVLRGERAIPLLKLFVLDVDMNNSGLAVRPYLSTAGTGKETLVPFLQRVGALAGVNGGYFGGSTSYSAVVYPGQVVAQNIASVTRTAGVYPVVRSFFGATARRTLSVNWIYHFGAAVSDVYRFAAPLANTPTTPVAPPTKAAGTPFDSLLTGIGGGPTLVKGGTLRYTYDEEVFFGSGVDGETANPRTAIGHTANRHVVFLVADGRQAGSVGATLPEMAQFMIDLGCVEAMNLDGGGSTQMAARIAGGYQYVDVPSESREVPTIFTVVRAESLQTPKEPTLETIIDTGDSLCTLLGGGWFASANPGYWSSTQAQLAPVGTGDKVAYFRVRLPLMLSCEVYAWWVASSNRATSTPFIVRHANGTDTVRVDQTQNGSKWFRLGTYTFRADTTSAVLVSNAAATGSYIVADAIRLLSYDTTPTSVSAAAQSIPQDFTLHQNYPNPFNPSTTIRFAVPEGSTIALRVFDLLGREVASLASGFFPPGEHAVVWDAHTLASGTYLCRMDAREYSKTIQILLVR